MTDKMIAQNNLRRHYTMADTIFDYKPTKKKMSGIGNRKYKKYLSSEQRRRKSKFRKRMILCAVLYVIATIAIIFLGELDSFLDNPESDIYQLVEGLLMLGGGLGSLISVCLFAKTLHAPLTLNERKELAEKEKYEKTNSFECFL